MPFETTRTNAAQTSGAKTILYLTYNLNDAAAWRRVRMLREGGAEVFVAGFARTDDPLPEDAIVLGRTKNGRLGARISTVISARLRLMRALKGLPRPDAIMARNLEVLALASPLARKFSEDGAGHVPLSYEVLDIHRMMLGDGAKSRALRSVERRLCRNVDRLVLSSEAFHREYFEKYGQCSAPTLIVENKSLAPPPEPRENPRPKLEPGSPIRIGWNGILRCKRSLALLDAATRQSPGRYRVVMRGRPALDEIPHFHDVVAANPDLSFDGPYDYPADLPRIYGDIDVAWLIDRYEAGGNSEWLLPNRLYEAGQHHVPGIVHAGSEVERVTSELGVGLVVKDDTGEAVHDALEQITETRVAELRAAYAKVPADRWTCHRADCEVLVAGVTGEAFDVAPKELAKVERVLESGGVLVVIPALNEEAHLGDVIDSIVPFLRRCGESGREARVVVADGGSEDGTQDVVLRKAGAMPGSISLLDNPKKLQSAGINLACETYGEGMSWLIRLDAHARYPDDYCDILLEEAQRQQAESIVVSMEATGTGFLQRAIAMAQNSPLGNGGAAHRNSPSGKFVDHGHHALMQMAGFRRAGGYDETFSHNEDAELDLRLASIGAQIWLTARTGLQYLPRDGAASLMRQYYNFGRGRARTMYKHGSRPRLRQLIMIALAPSVALALFAPWLPILAIFLVVWMTGCLLGGLALALSRRSLLGLAAGPLAGMMHLAWSAGFWRQMVLNLTSGQPYKLPARPKEAAPLTPERVAVGICTFRRDQLLETLESLEDQRGLDGVPLTLIVSDNDRSDSARAMVERFGAMSRHEVIYLHAPAENISVARNAILRQARAEGIEVLAFIDDDEIASRNWVSQLLRQLQADDAEIVVGPVQALYPSTAPAWMRQRRVHDTRPELDANGRPIAGHSCNVMIRLAAAPFDGLRFDPALGATGGEDTAFFEQARRNGARFVMQPAAMVTETVPPTRMSLRWLLLRRYRMGHTHAQLHFCASAMSRAENLPLALAKFGYCMCLAVVLAPLPGPRNDNLIRGALHLGAISSMLGFRQVILYGSAEKSSA
ncbi:glycosyltransferase [Pseudoroseicyclus tamaricis]|uniref:Glycosyltransferase n=1 Tax=Pseudoroseicyclus tamaricis TaxID=2705421 RepID=A0A6B2JIV6_9RHOB|nr:glycosyltransferase [Pseudoroseicyclus tamaricis]NDV01341.1 glycosyltransferase [Pseudoroseicyclus tamaricis]